MPRHWLMKSEPKSYSIDDLERDGTTAWDSIRNYLARNYMRDEMQVGDSILFYHSNAAPPGVAGLAKVSSEPYADPTQFDPGHPYSDPKATTDAPRWHLVDIAFVERFPRVVGLPALREHARLQDMLVLQRGQRLSIQPVEAADFAYIVNLGRAVTEPQMVSGAPRAT